MTGKINEYELLYMIRQKDEYAFKLLADYYLPIFYKTYGEIKSYWSFSDYDECYQAYLIGLNNAINCYRSDKYTKFSNFVYLCATREMKAIVKKYKRKDSIITSQALSLDNHLSDNDQIYLIDTIADNNSDPKSIVKAKLLRELAFEYLDNDFDKEVLKMRLLGYNYQQMSEVLNCTKKKIDNSLQRIKQKLISLFD